MDRVRLRHQQDGSMHDAALPLDRAGTGCVLRLRCLPGANAAHLVLCNQEGVQLRAEIEVNGSEQLLVEVELDEQARLVVTSANRRMLTLPPDDRYDPAAAIPSAVSSDALDLALVIDGTAQHFYWEELEHAREPRSRSLLQDQEQWSPVVAKLQSLLTAVSELWPQSRFALLAFGDQPVPQVSARDLLPSYLLHPQRQDRRVLRDRPLAELVEELQHLPASSGGDYVDALADALHACSKLHWRPEARKIAVVVGDSPGHSVQCPVPRGGDACVRDLDVDVEAMRLHRCGVELLTVYLEPALAADMAVVSSYRRLLEHTREQYRRLASLPSLAYRLPGFDPEAVALQLRERAGSIGRGATYPELLEILPGHGAAADGSTAP